MFSLLGMHYISQFFTVKIASGTVCSLLNMCRKTIFNSLGLLSLPLSAWDKYIEHPLASRLASHQATAPYKAFLDSIISRDFFKNFFCVVFITWILISK